MLKYPQLDPIVFYLGPFQIRWYGLAYLFGILSAFLLLRNELKLKLFLNSDQILNFFTYVTIGILVGGRLGYVLIYDLNFYLHHLFDIIAIWRGGMSYHGGALGALFATYIFSRVNQKSFLGLMDMLCWGSTIGIFFGRIANFINAELFGRITDLPWGMVFPLAGPFPRHPSQLYEAFFEGLLLGLFLSFIYRRSWYKKGVLVCFYLIGYGFFRFFLEFFREPDIQVGYLWLELTMGQWLCVLMIILGMVVLSTLLLTSKNTKKV